jgi:crossover junction endodeoxyribonuclease RusA
MPHKGERVPVLLTAYPPVKRNRDSDNLLSSAKPHLDGIARALGINDTFFDPRVQWADVCKGGKLVVSVG